MIAHQYSNGFEEDIYIYIYYMYIYYIYIYMHIYIYINKFPLLPQKVYSTLYSGDS